MLVQVGTCGCLWVYKGVCWCIWVYADVCGRTRVYVGLCALLEITYCKENEHVANNKCTPCKPGTTNKAGDGGYVDATFADQAGPHVVIIVEDFLGSDLRFGGRIDVVACELDVLPVVQAVLQLLEVDRLRSANKEKGEEQGKDGPQKHCLHFGGQR